MINKNDSNTWLDVIWHALECYREDCISGDEHDQAWDDICTVMAWISDKVGE